MPFKDFTVEGLGTVRVTKRSTSKSIRLSIAASGDIRVSQPGWLPYAAGLDFARQRQEWIVQHRPEPAGQLQDGDRIGKAHRLLISSAATDKPAARLSGSEIRLSKPIGWADTHPAVQKAAASAAIRALRSEAEGLLPQRLKTLASQGGFTYGSVSVKRLKGRWGSCDNKSDIVLNLFLMQLPWQLIDYVLWHELTHTRHLNHSPDFWRELQRHEPQARQLRALTHTHQPVLQPTRP